MSRSDSSFESLRLECQIPVNVALSTFPDSVNLITGESIDPEDDVLPRMTDEHFRALFLSKNAQARSQNSNQRNERGLSSPNLLADYECSKVLKTSVPIHGIPFSSKPPSDANVSSDHLNTSQPSNSNTSNPIRA
ncbi:hypothetical protein L484_021733 [Morus notabilis]|uniref:Uncharacterized protein n=1 Tax=Morus notabilis TaxID=981085 RepID=W9RW83_9ROSA|nr:hypothetical protein L484_021733 [Morus notabilis]